MDLNKVILYIYPDLIPRRDFEVINNNTAQQVVTWVTRKYTEPTTSELAAASIKLDIQTKLESLRDINNSLIQLWWTNRLASYTEINTKRTSRITELDDAFATLRADLWANYDNTQVANIATSVFRWM